MGEKLIKEYLKDILIYIKEIEQIQLDAKNIDGLRVIFILKEQVKEFF